VAPEASPVVPVQVGVQPVFLQVLKERAPGAVHDALRHACGAGGVHDVQRVVEGQLGEVDPGLVGQEVLPGDGLGQAPDRTLDLAGVLPHERHQDHALDAVELLQHAADALDRVQRLARVEVAVRGEQDLGRDLTKAVEHAVDAEIR
jgi:hypothetical protein